VTPKQRDSHSVTPNGDLAGRATEIASQSGPGLTRKAALCVAVAGSTTKTHKAARTALADSDVLPEDVRAAAIELLDHLTNHAEQEQSP
jgi:hypothetical protein